MSVVPIVKIPNKILNTQCNKVELNEQTKTIVMNLRDTLRATKNPVGVGLAAPQIGANARICLVREFDSEIENNKPTKSAKEYVLINPEIISKSKRTAIDWEACLSIPNLYGKVKRNRKITVKALDENEYKLKAKGFLARVIQHEIDHLDGILYTSKVIGDIMTEEDAQKLETKENIAE